MVEIPALPSEWFERPMNLLVAGSSRSPVNLLGIAVAQSLAERFIWLEVRDPFDPPSPEERRAYERLPRELRFIAHQPEELRPDDADANLALWTLMPSEPGKSTPPLAESLRMPVLVRKILDRVVRTESPVLLVVANADRLSEFYPDHEASTVEWLRLLREERLSLIATSTGPTRRDWSAFESVFRVEAGDGGAGEEPSVVVDRVGPPTPGWESGTQRALSRMPGMAALLSSGA